MKLENLNFDKNAEAESRGNFYKQKEIKYHKLLLTETLKYFLKNYLHLT